VETSFINLSRSDAEDVFGRYLKPMPVIDEWSDRLQSDKFNALETDDDFHKLYMEIRFLLVVTGMYIKYSSADVREIIQNLCSRYIHDIYLNEDQRRLLSDLKFIGAIIFRHRNIKEYRKLKKFFAEPAHIDKIRYWLFQIGARAEYQASLF